MKSFLLILRMRAQQLIFSILSNYVEPGYTVAMKILRHDARFVQVWKETKDQSDKISAFFMEKQSHSG